MSSVASTLAGAHLQLERATWHFSSAFFTGETSRRQTNRSPPKHPKRGKRKDLPGAGTETEHARPSRSRSRQRASPPAAFRPSGFMPIEVGIIQWCLKWFDANLRGCVRPYYHVEKKRRERNIPSTRKWRSLLECICIFTVFTVIHVFTFFSISDFFNGFLFLRNTFLRLKYV